MVDLSLREDLKNGKFDYNKINSGTQHTPHPIDDIFNHDKLPVGWTPALLISMMTNVTSTNTYFKQYSQDTPLNCMISSTSSEV